MPKKINHKAYRDELADRAAMVFRQHGYKGIGLRDIAQELGVSKSALYHYFPSKEALFAACAERASRLDVKAGGDPVREVVSATREWEPLFMGDLRIMMDYLENRTGEDIWSDPVSRAGFKSMERSLAGTVEKPRIASVLSAIFGFLLYRGFRGGRRAPYSILEGALKPLLTVPSGAGKALKRAVGVGLAVLLPIMSPAVEPVPAVFTLDESVRFGLEHSTSARKARSDEDIARTQIGQAGSLALPHVTLNASYRRLDEVQTISFGDDNMPMGTLDNYEVTAGVSQLLYSGGQVGAALRAARLAREHADAMRRATESALVREITVQFHGVLLAEAAVTVQEASVAQLEAYAEQARLRGGSGAASEFEQLTARVRLANEIPQLIAARNRHALAAAAFSTLLNHPGPLAVTGSLETAGMSLKLEDMETLALDNRQELRGSGIRVGLGNEAVVNARSEGLPSLRAFFNYHGANAYQFVSFEDDWEWHWNAGVALSWNLWDGNLTRQTVRQKRFELDRLQTDQEAQRAQVLLDVRQAWLGLVHARQSLEASGDSVALAERALEIARMRYQAGLSTYLELTDANLALSTARLVRLQALHDHAVAVANVNFACGL